MTKRKKENREFKNLQETIEEIKKQFGEGAIMRLTEVIENQVESIPTEK